MRTSHLQNVAMVEFMESNGDLSKPSSGPRGRHFIQRKWNELTTKLNSDGTGDPRSEEKWRKVWSDFKSNCKKKCAKINRAASGTGGGPALQLSLTDLEKRVMQIIGVQAAIGMATEEAGFHRNVASETPHQPLDPSESFPEALSEIAIEDWNTPGTSSQPTVTPSLPPPSEVHFQSSPVALIDEEWKPPQRKKKNNDIFKKILESDTKAREHDRVYEEMEKERLRLRSEELKLKTEEMRVRDYEIRERVRQRAVELQLQGAWLEFMKQAMEVFARYMERKS